MKRFSVIGVVLLGVLAAATLTRCGTGGGNPTAKTGSIAVVPGASQPPLQTSVDSDTTTAALHNVVDQEDVRQPEAGDPPAIFDR